MNAMAVNKSRMRNAAEPEADAGEQRPDQRSDDDTEGDAADGLPGEPDRPLAGLAAETMRKREDAARGDLAAGVANREGARR